MGQPIRKRLFWDIETSPNIGFFWQPGRRVNIPYQNIIHERAIICISYKWEGGEVQTLTWNKNQDDRGLLKKFVKVLKKAKEIVAHNGDNFDVKWIKARCLKFGIDVPPSFITIDTLKLSRKHFRLNSHRLDYIGHYLGLNGKEETGGFDLWRDIILDKCPKAMAKMVKYCERDVQLLEQIYNRFKPYIIHRTHYGVLYDNEKYTCPECTSNNVQCFNTRVTAMGIKRRQMKCNKCNTRFTISNKTYMRLVVDRPNFS
jgi:predicted PolB exonuclease-like 3'-5' exonuclease